MALKTYTGTNYDDHIGTTTLTGSTVSITSAGITSAAYTALNTTNKDTGAWVFINSLPSIGNIGVTLQESTVDKVTALINLADAKLGWNYVRFGTPYQWTTISAGAYRFKVYNTSTNSGTLRTGASGLAYTATYDTATTLGSTDDLWVGGFNDSGLTAKSLTLTGTFSLGSGTDKLVNTGTTGTIGAGITIGNGGSVKVDQTASTTMTLRGSIFITNGGLFDWRAHTSDKTKVAKLIFDCETADGNYCILNAAGGYGGQYLIEGAEYNRYTTYGGGAGTAADPFLTQTAVDAAVGDQIVVGGGADHLKIETRYVITRNSAQSFVLSTTVGGAEAALTYTHATGAPVGNMSSNCIVTSLNTTRGYYIANPSTNAVYSSLNYSRLEYSSSVSGKGVSVELGTAAADSYGTCDGVVLYSNSSGNRSALIFQSSNVTQTIDSVICYNNFTTNGAGVGALGLIGAANKTFTNGLLLNGAGSTSCGPLLGIQLNSANNAFQNYYFDGGNSNGSSSNSAIYISSPNITFDSVHINATRVQGILLAGAVDTTFNNLVMGDMATNTIDIGVSNATYNTVLFNNGNFNSATLISSNFSNMLEGSLVRFHKYQQTDNRHRWYTRNGISWSSGAGLDKTTVATAGSLAVATAPTTATGTKHTFPFNVNIGEVISVYGKFWANATMVADGAAELTAELYLPGSLTPDRSVTLTKTTDDSTNDAVFSMDIVNTSSTNDVAKLVLVATNPNGTAGVEAYYDDLNGGTNKISALDIWYEGQPFAFYGLPQTLGDVAAIVQAVLGNTSTWGSTTIGGKIQGTNTTVGTISTDTSLIKKIVKRIFFNQ